MKKRFIAGVVCPKCSAQDSIMAYEEPDNQVMVRECIDCGFTDRLSTVVNQPAEMNTRVTPASQTTELVPQVVKIIEP